MTLHIIFAAILLVSLSAIIAMLIYRYYLRRLVLLRYCYDFLSIFFVTVKSSPEDTTLRRILVNLYKSELPTVIKALDDLFGETGHLTPEFRKELYDLAGIRESDLH